MNKAFLLVIFGCFCNIINCQQFPRISCTPGWVIPHPTDCSSFIKCGFNDVDNFMLQCTYPTLFNRNTLRCDMPGNVKCAVFRWVARPYIPMNEFIPKGDLIFIYFSLINK